MAMPELSARTRRFPPWIRVRWPAAGACSVSGLAALLSKAGLHTVCQSAQCPNRPACHGRGTATFLLLGDVCTRHCGFCAVRSGQPGPPDPDEPRRVAEAAARLALRHVVVTSVTRDDLPDGGASAFAATVRAVHDRLPRATVEVLTPDLGGREHDVATVLAAEPQVFNHNLETVRRLQPLVRPAADYERSLAVLRTAAAWRPRVATKSGLILGLGETRAEVLSALQDLRVAGCTLLTLGQYLAPSTAHLPVARYVEEAEFEALALAARRLGFVGVAAGPLVRSSYHAEVLYREWQHKDRGTTGSHGTDSSPASG